MKRLDKIEELLYQCERDAKRLKEIKKEVKNIESNRKKLVKYYEGDYVKDYDNAKKFKKEYRMLDDDSIWNVITDQYEGRLKLIKVMVKSL